MDKMKEKRVSDNVAELKAREKGEPIASFLKMRILELTPAMLR